MFMALLNQRKEQTAMNKITTQIKVIFSEPLGNSSLIQVLIMKLLMERFVKVDKDKYIKQ